MMTSIIKNSFIVLSILFIISLIDDTLAVKCSKSNCIPPECRCSQWGIPSSLPYEEVPQFVYLTFDDAVHGKNIGFIRQIFTEGNEGGDNNTCPAVGTFFVSHEYTDYSLLNELYSQGHEIALHSITHGHFGNPSTEQLYSEFIGQRKIIAEFADIPESEVVGVRMPFLQLAGDKQYKLLKDNGLLYDFSRTQWNSKRMWPYTLDYDTTQDCFLGPCPTKSFPGLWQIPLITWKDRSGSPCAMSDGCQNIPNTVDELVEFFKTNFHRIYDKANKAPFSFCIHAAWFEAEEPPLAGQNRLNAYIKFMKYLRTLPDVFMVTASEVIDWIRHPVPVSLMRRQGRDCRPITKPCTPKGCNVCKGRELRWFMSCKKNCPESYPWLNNFKGENECGQ